jgi:hypothetical protein
MPGIGIGITIPLINKKVSVLSPTELTLTAISGGVKVDWVDNALGTGVVEVWAKNNLDAYTLIDTVNAGVETIDDLCDPVAFRYYKVRSKISGSYSKFTTEVSIEMLDASSINLFGRLLVKGETPTNVRKVAMDTAIRALKAASLFDTQFDVFVVTRGTGPYTRKENWIKDSSHALAVANGGTLSEHDDIGIHCDGVNSYLRTQYTPSIEGSLFKRDDACFGLKLSGVIGIGYHGAYDGTLAYHTCMYTGGGQNSSINGAVKNIEPVAGYSCMSRFDSTHWDGMVNASIINNDTATSIGLTNKELYIFRINHTSPIPVPDTQIVEMYWMGKQLSQAKFLTLQTIMNTYFSSL